MFEKTSISRNFFIGRTELIVLDHKTTEETMRDLQILQIAKFIEQYRGKWTVHFGTMSSDKIPERF